MVHEHVPGHAELCAEAALWELADPERTPSERWAIFEHGLHALVEVWPGA